MTQPPARPQVVLAPTAEPGQEGAAGRDTGPPGSLLARLSPLLAPLFPPSPAAARPRSAAVQLVASLAAIALGTVIMLARQSGVPAWRTLWAEDRDVFLPQALASSARSLVTPYAGYLELYPSHRFAVNKDEFAAWPRGPSLRRLGPPAGRSILPDTAFVGFGAIVKRTPLDRAAALGITCRRFGIGSRFHGPEGALIADSGLALYTAKARPHEPDR